MNKLNEKIDKMLPDGAPKDAGDMIKSRVYTHRIIKIRTGLSCKLFFAKLMGPFFCNNACGVPNNKLSKYMRLYERGEERVENELDICYIIKTLRLLTVWMKNTKLSKQVKFEMQHSNLNLINLDEDSFSDSDDNDSSSSDDEKNRPSMFEEAGIGKGSKVAASGSEGGAKYAEETPGRGADVLT